MQFIDRLDSGVVGNISLIEILAKLGVEFIPFLFALCFHEYAHAYIAKRRGDNTAQLMGRLTLNPFAHSDLIGTWVLPIAGILAGLGGFNGGAGFIFGWAKPVPVNSRNFKRPREDMFWVAFAGPLSNLLLAAVAIVLYIILGVAVHDPSLLDAIETMLSHFVLINMLLAVFNLIPLYPLDGAKILERFVPYSWSRFLEEHQNMLQILLIVFFIAGGFQVLAIPIDWMTNTMFRVISAILSPLL